MMYSYLGMAMWGGALLMIFFGVGIIILVIWALTPSRHEIPLDPDQLRYVRGEISYNEYLALIDDLKLSKEATK